MRKYIKYQIVTLLAAFYVISGPPAHAADDDVVWKSGLNLYFKLREQDDTRYGKNDHPVDLDSNTISTALESLVYVDETLFTANEVVKPVFPSQQIKLLGTNLSKGLKQAKPDQDIIFVMEKSYRKLAILTERALVAGRAFYKDGKLNLIIGDYNLARNEAFEAVYDPSGKGNVPYNLNHGYRSKSTSGFKENTIKIAGVENKIAGKQRRRDWFVIDVKVAAEAVIADKNNKNKSNEAVNTEAFQQEAERLARERRQLRLEMAKMRKEMQEGANNKEQLTIEERLANLDELREKELINENEYEQKRKEILDDI